VKRPIETAHRDVLTHAHMRRQQETALDRYVATVVKDRWLPSPVATLVHYDDQLCFKKYAIDSRHIVADLTLALAWIIR
jgi:hypothetical protein